MKRVNTFWFMLIFTACSAPVDTPPDPTLIFTAPPPVATETQALPSPTATQPPTATLTPTSPPALALDDVPAYLTSVPESFNSDVCKDTRVLQLLSDLGTAIRTRNGQLLASLVIPDAGVGVQYIRNGNVITYFENIKFVFETTYEAEWGFAPGSGEPVVGSFQKVILPSLELVFGSNPVLTCNEIKTGGATYAPQWPYQGIEFYSVHFPGTEEFGGLNWETWAVGIMRDQGKPMLSALVRFAWEP
ncbi:MAG: hypothetical protein HXY38_00445 [Chloroflexi bacterium]|nr:hypothetical protein [Chloroflexota bacterium]